ncbi:MAG: dephospho-CoA kinase [Flavobacterium sp.]
MTKIIGLTGGIGSGKSTVARYINSKGIPVYIADDEARLLTDSVEVKDKIVATFGDKILNNGILDRKILSEIVFNNAENLQKLNSIIHPAVREHFINWLKLHQNNAYVVKEAAILFESGSYKDCDIIISVEAPQEVRIERVMLRDGTSREAVEARMRNQWSDEMRAEKSDFVIVNTDLKEMEAQVNNFLKKLPKLQ